MSRTVRLARAAGSLVALAVLAGVVYLGLSRALSLLGLGTADAGAVGTAVAVAVALAVADAYTPVGRGPRREGLAGQPPGSLAADVALAALAATATGVALVALGGAVWPPLGGSLVVVVAGTGAGYLAFMLRNRRYYLLQAE